MTTPSLAGYLTFIRTGMKVNTIVLPDGSYWINASYNWALQMVNWKLLLIPQPAYPSPFPIPTAPTLNPYPSLYAIAVYNLAADLLVQMEQDDPDADPIPGTNPPVAFWAWTRSLYKIDNFIAGVVTSTSDNSSSTSLMTPELFSQLNMMDLQTLKTPWGRRYMAIVGQMGPTDWGIS